MATNNRATQTVNVPLGKSTTILVRGHTVANGVDQYTLWGSIDYAGDTASVNTINTSSNTLIQGGSIAATSSTGSLTTSDSSSLGNFDFANKTSGYPTITGSGIILNQYGLAGYANGTNEFYIDARSGSTYFNGKLDTNSVVGTTTLGAIAAGASQGSSAYNLAQNALHMSGDVIVNASGQLTNVSANGTTFYSGSSSTSGARVLLNSYGILGYDSTSTSSTTGYSFVLTNQYITVPKPGGGTQTLNPGALYLNGPAIANGSIIGSSLTSGLGSSYVYINEVTIPGSSSTIGKIGFIEGGTETMGILSLNGVFQITPPSPATTLLTLSSNTSTIGSSSNKITISSGAYGLGAYLDYSFGYGNGATIYSSLASSYVGGLRNIIVVPYGSIPNGSDGDIYVAYTG